MTTNNKIRQLDRKWRMKNSWWVLLPFLMLGGVSFIYIGKKAHRRDWSLWGIVYLVLSCVPLFLINHLDGAEWLIGLVELSFCFPLVHALVVRNEYLICLDAIQSNNTKRPVKASNHADDTKATPVFAEKANVAEQSAYPVKASNHADDTKATPSFVEKADADELSAYPVKARITQTIPRQLQCLPKKPMSMSYLPTLRRIQVAQTRLR